MEINGFYFELYFKNGWMHLNIKSKKYDLMEALVSKAKEWIKDG